MPCPTDSGALPAPALLSVSTSVMPLLLPATAPPPARSIRSLTRLPTLLVSSSVMVVSVGRPSTSTGASFAGVTLKVMVLADGSRFTPLLALPPLSCT